MDQNRFDDLTRTLATSTSRRQALKLLGGGLLAALVPGSVLAKGGGNSACAKFCAQVFGANTKAADKCTSDAAKGKGLCYTCGPAAPANHPPLCSQTCCSTTVANATATCNNGTCGFTCNTGFKECDGACIPNDQECCTIITPNDMSPYILTCYNISLTCSSEGTLLSADCEDVFGDPVATSIIVDTCSSSNYVINNCNATLTCGGC